MDLEKEILALKERNRRVEMDKAWETSLFRKLIIAALTYAGILLFFLSAGIQNPYTSALVPTAGFLLSTLSLPWFRKIWESFRTKH